MWVKDGKNYADEGLIVGNHWHSTPTPEMMRANGWEWVEPPKRYSKRKIIDALGAEAWEDKKAELEAAGFYDKFVNSTYLCVDDPDFAAIYEHLTDEEKRILNEECIWDE